MRFKRARHVQRSERRSRVWGHVWRAAGVCTAARGSRAHRRFWHLKWLCRAKGRASAPSRERTLLVPAPWGRGHMILHGVPFGVVRPFARPPTPNRPCSPVLGRLLGGALSASRRWRLIAARSHLGNGCVGVACARWPAAAPCSSLTILQIRGEEQQRQAESSLKRGSKRRRKIACYGAVVRQCARRLALISLIAHEGFSRV